MIASGQPYKEEIAFKPNRNIEKKQQNQLMKLAQISATNSLQPLM
jgi:hypothetical protein